MQLDVFTLSETWLKQCIHSDVVALQGLQSIRLDWGSKCKLQKRGGGLIPYIHNKHSFSCEMLHDLSASNNSVEAQ